MKEFTYTVAIQNGIHVRMAGMLVKLLQEFKCSVILFRGEESVDMKRLLALMCFGVKQGDTVTIRVEGEDEDACAAELEKALKENF